MKANSYPELFLAISSALTGFSITELEATGMAETYYQTVLANVAPQNIKLFLEKAFEILNDKHLTQQAVEEAIATHLMPDICYGGLAKNIIMLWYTGDWAGVTVSAATYIQGLMWPAAHTHPAGAKQPGFGSWANKPLV